MIVINVSPRRGDSDWFTALTLRTNIVNVSAKWYTRRQCHWQNCQLYSSPAYLWRYSLRVKRDANSTSSYSQSTMTRCFFLWTPLLFSQSNSPSSVHAQNRVLYHVTSDDHVHLEVPHATLKHEWLPFLTSRWRVAQINHTRFICSWSFWGCISWR